MTQSKGFEDGSDRVCKLKKALYGLKQSARCWNRKFTSCQKEFNLKASEADPCVFAADTCEEKLILAIYIDDGLIASTCKQRANELLEFLAIKIEITIMPLRLFLGMEIEHLPDGSLLVNQTKYARKIIERFRMEDAHAVSIPSDQHQDLSLRHFECEGKAIEVPYKEVVGELTLSGHGNQTGHSVCCERSESIRGVTKQTTLECSETYY